MRQNSDIDRRGDPRGGGGDRGGMDQRGGPGGNRLSDKMYR